MFTVEEEEEMADYAVKMADMGFGLSREDLQLSISSISKLVGWNFSLSLLILWSTHNLC